MPIINDSPDQNMETIRRELQQYVTLKDEGDAIAERVTTIKKRLTSYIEDLGEPNEKGSLVLPVEDERTNTRAIVKQRRVSKQFDETRLVVPPRAGLTNTATELSVEDDAVQVTTARNQVLANGVGTFCDAKVAPTIGVKVMLSVDSSH
jgi:hypothetical protein